MGLAGAREAKFQVTKCGLYSTAMASSYRGSLATSCAPGVLSDRRRVTDTASLMAEPREVVRELLKVYPLRTLG